MNVSKQYSIKSIFFKVLKQQILKSYKQWIVFAFLICFCIFSTLFYNYISDFNDAFIDRLKGVYPALYIKSHGEIIKEFDERFKHKQEFFYFSETLTFKYSKQGNKKSIIDVGIKAADILDFPDIINVPELNNNTNHIWVNNILWEMIINTPEFDNKGLYLISEDGMRQFYVFLHKFDLLGDRAWIIFPKELALTLGKTMNITTIYSIVPVANNKIKKLYFDSGFNAILWTERLPFFNYVFYHLTLRIYSILTFGLLIVLVIFVVGVLNDTFDEFKKLIIFSSLYGVKESFIQTFFIFFISSYFLLIFVFSILSVYFINKIICNMIPIIGMISKNSLSTIFYLSIIPIICLISFFFIKRKYNEN